MQDSSWLKRTLFNFFQERGQSIARRRKAGQESWWDRLVWKIGDLLVYRPLQERLGLRNCWMPFSGAAPIAPDLLWWFWGLGIRVSEGYGQTESSGVSHGGAPNNARIGTVGRALPGIECVLADDGEILIRGAAVFCGYLHNEQATQSTIDEQGWLHTGDIGTFDDDGYLLITGRKKEIIITAGGKNLSPEKIENALKMSTFIKEVIAIGDRRKFIGALVQIDYPAVSDWASRRNLVHTSFIDLSAKDEVEALIGGEIERANEKLARVEQVRAFRLLNKELHQDDGELTATQKVRRSAVVEIHDELIESMYGGRPK
jgi:long-chain acyl-CoA synthetase